MSSKGPFNVWVKDDGTWELAPATQGGGTAILGPTSYPASLVPRKEISLTAPANIPAFNGDLYVSAGDNGGALTLPTLASSRPGNRIFIYRPEGLIPSLTCLSTIPIVTANAADRINGWDDAGVTTLSLQGTRHLIVIERSPSGWMVTQSDAMGSSNNALPTGALGSSTLAPWAGLKVFTFGVAGGLTLTLPALDDVPNGSRGIFFRTGGTLTHRVQAATGEDFDGVADGGVNLTLRGRAVEIIRTNSGWFTISNPLQAAEPVIVAAGTEDLSAESWYGLRSFSMGQNTTLVLPATSLAVPGSTYALVRAASTGVTVDAGTSTISAGGSVAATLALNQDEPVLLVNTGLGWYGVGAT